VILSRRFVVGMTLAIAVIAPQTGSAQATTSHPTPANLAAGLVGDSRQLIIVSSTGWKANRASVSLYELRPAGWKRVAGPFFARVGRNGMRIDHVEGDGTTPAGSFPLVSAFGLRANPGTKLPWTKLKSGDCWISDSTRPDYNTMVVQKPCGSQNEDLWSIARRGAYTKAIVSGYNMNPVVAGKGSAIFLHLHSRTASGSTKPTSGCVSLSDWQLSALLRRIDPASDPRVVMGPANWLKEGDSAIVRLT